MARKYTGDVLKQVEAQYADLVREAAGTILVVDPSMANRRTVANALAAAGNEAPLEAKDGREALRAAALADPVIVALVEAQLPDMAAADFIRALRSEGKAGERKVILATSETRRERLVPLVQAGLDGYVQKPFQPEVLLAKLREIGAL